MIDPHEIAARLTEAIAVFQAHALGLAVGIAGVAAGLALASEVFAWIAPLRDYRRNFLARALGVAPVQVVPIGDGIQLWRDAHALAGDPDGGILPPGTATLKGSYAALVHGRLHLVAVHTLRDAGLRDNDGELEAVVAVADPGSGFVGLEPISQEVDHDIVARANLLEALANARFGYSGPVSPVLLFRGRMLLEDSGERTASGMKAQRRKFRGEGIDRALTPEGGGAFESKAGFEALSRYLRRQPARGTPRRKIARRAIIALGSVAFVVATGQLAVTPESIASFRGALGF